MNRADWQQIAEERLLAAESLLAAGLWASAYYLAGYAVEGGLKSCILVHVTSFPELLFREGGNRFSADCWTHDIEKLVSLAGLATPRKADMSANRALEINWEIAAKWNEKSRYQLKAQSEAELLYNALTDKANGVMPWIRARW